MTHPVPEGVHGVQGVLLRNQVVGPKGQDREKKPSSQAVGEEGADDSPRGRDALYEGEGLLGQRETVAERL